MQEVLAKHVDASLTIRVDGPPHFKGNRVIIEGSTSAFRMLADMLLTMADAVDNPERNEHIGWGLVFDPNDVPQLKMDDDYMLTLDCEPESRGPA